MKGCYPLAAAFLIVALSGCSKPSPPAPNFFTGADFIALHESNIPQEVITALTSSCGHFIMADRDRYFNAGDVVRSEPEPNARLIAAARFHNRWFIYYEHGGIGLYEALAVLEASKDTDKMKVSHYYVDSDVRSIQELELKVGEGNLKAQPYC